MRTQVEYNESVHGREVTMEFRPPKGALTFAVAVSSHKFSPIPENNMAAMSYDEAIYINVNVGRIVSMTVAILSLIAFTALLFYRKMMGLELITMVQLIYLGTILTEYSHPFMGPLTELGYINGYNGVDMEIDSDPASTPYRTIGLHRYFF